MIALSGQLSSSRVLLGCVTELVIQQLWTFRSQSAEWGHQPLSYMPGVKEIGVERPGEMGALFLLTHQHSTLNTHQACCSQGSGYGQRSDKPVLNEPCRPSDPFWAEVPSPSALIMAWISWKLGRGTGWGRLNALLPFPILAQANRSQVGPMFITFGFTSFSILTLGWSSAYSSWGSLAEERTPGLQAGGAYWDCAVIVCCVCLWTQGSRKATSVGTVQKP